MNSMITLESVSKEYKKGLFGRRFKALDNVSFTVSTGESIGFIGHNGAGKSTAIRIIMGLQSFNEGNVLLQGRSPRLPDSRRQVAYVPESPLLYDHLSPSELLRFSMVSHGIGSDEIRSRTDQWLERLSLSAVAHKRIRQFSKGMVQRCALAMALAPQPRLLILDEPLSGLDPSGRREIVEILSEYHAAGGTMLFSSHVLTDVEALADRFLFIHKGRIRVSGTPGALLSNENERFEIIVEVDGTPPADFVRLYGRHYKQELEAAKLEAALSAIRQTEGIRLINIRSCNTLESAYFRFVAEAEAADALSRQ